MSSQVDIPTRCWGDDDHDDDQGSLSSGEGVYVQELTQPEVVKKIYPFQYTERRSTYDRVLYFVDGTPILDEKNTPLNVWTKDFEDELKAKRIRCVHVCMQRPGYRYFVRSLKEKNDFIQDRDRGFSTRHISYTIYPDEPGVILKAKNNVASRIFRSPTT